MTEKSLSTRQVCIVLFAYGAILKLVMYPSLLANISGKDLVFPALFALAVQSVMVWSVAFLSSKTEKTFFELLSGTFGSVTAKIFYALFGLYFLFSAIVPMNENQLLVHDAFYDTIPSLSVFVPFFFFSVYAGARSFKNLGRCADICLPIFALAIALFILMSYGQGEYSNLLPVLKQPFKAIGEGGLASLFRFSDSAFLLVFLGHFKYKKGDCAKMTLSYIAGGLIVLLFLIIFYSIYGALTPSRTFMFNNIAVFFPPISILGRIDLFLLYVLTVVMLFAIVMHVQACVHCFSIAFGWEKRAFWSIVANVVLVAATLLINNRFALFYITANKWFFIPALIFAYLIPVLVWVLKRRAE